MKLDAKPSPQLHASSPQSGGAGASAGVSTGAGSPMSSVNPNHVGSHNNQGDTRGTVLNQNSGQSHAQSQSQQPQTYVVTQSRTLTQAEQQQLQQTGPPEVRQALSAANTDAKWYVIEAKNTAGSKQFFLSLEPRQPGSLITINALPNAQTNEQQKQVLDHLLRQYQPLLEKLTTKPLPADLNTSQLDYANRATNSANNVSESPNTRTQDLNHDSALAISRKQNAQILVTVSPTLRTSGATPSTARATGEDTIENSMKLPPNDSAKHADSHKPQAADLDTNRATSKASLTLPVEQIRQLNQQWVEVVSVRRQNEQQFQLEVKTPQGKIVVMANQSFSPGQQLQLALTIPNNTSSPQNSAPVPVIQLDIIQGKPPLPSQKDQPLVQSQTTQANLLNALRQYQPLKSTLQVLALQQIESGRMQSLADDVRQQVSLQLRHLVQPSSVETLKQTAQTLLSGQTNTSNTTGNPANANTSAAAQTTHTSSAGLTPSGAVPANQTSQSAAPLAPNSLLNPSAQMGAAQVRTAIAQAGQQLENHLATLAQQNAQTNKQSAPTQQPTQPTSTLGMNLSRGFAHINQNLQSGIKDLLRDLAGRSSVAKTDTSATTTASTTAQAATQTTKTAASTSADTSLLSSLKEAVRNDMKAWLMQNQIHLMQAIQADPKGKQDQKDLMDGLLKVLFNRVSSAQPTVDSEGQRILPKNLSVQPQLQKLFSGLLTQSQSDDGDQQPLRQLLSLTQTLTRIQQEQVMNRQQQVQNPESPEFQMSLPYLQDKQINWCELEFGPHTEQENTKQARRGWHLILRFEQAEQGAFAVEASLAGHELSLALWSHTQERLKQFHQHMELLKRKLQEAGFVCEHIQSKHGMPERKQRQIQQGLVDVRT